MQKQDLEKYVAAALESHNGRATIIQVSKFI